MNERYCPKCGKFKALSAALCDRCAEKEMANGADPHVCPQCGKFKFIFQEVCYGCKPEQNNNTSRPKTGYAYKVSYQEVTYEYEAPPEEQNYETDSTYTDFHKKYGHKNKYKCKCGIYVKSKDERTIADFLYENKIPFQYEEMNDYYAYDVNWNRMRRREIYPDFFIKGPVTFQGRKIENVYIEYWGMDTPKYLKRKAEKYEVYKNNNCTLISIYPEDLFDSENGLTKKLTQFKDRQINY